MGADHTTRMTPIFFQLLTDTGSCWVYVHDDVPFGTFDCSIMKSSLARQQQNVYNRSRTFSVTDRAKRFAERFCRRRGKRENLAMRDKVEDRFPNVFGQQRKTLLVLSFFPAFSPPKSGGEIRLCNLYKELSQFFNIVLLSSTNIDVECETYYHCENFIERRIPKSLLFVDQWQRLQEIAGKGDLSGPCLGAIGKQPSQMHLAYLEEYPKADIIVHEFPFTLEYDLFHTVDTKPRVYNSHNCETELYQQLHSGDKSKPIRELVADLETRLLRRADLICYCGANDLQAFTTLTGERPRNSLFLPNATSIRATPKRKKRLEFVKKAVFIGSGHLPNVDAAKRIVNDIAPATPEMEFHIVGACLPQGKYPPNVVRHGAISNNRKAEIFAEADVAINPVTSGSGSNLKIFEFLENELPLFSTSFGMRGVNANDGIHYINAEISEFPTVLKRWLKEPARLTKIGEAGRDLVLRQFNWRVVANQYAQQLDRLSPGDASPMSNGCVLALNDYNFFTSVGGGATRSAGLYNAVAEESPVIVLCLGNNAQFSIERVSQRLAVIEVPKTAQHLSRQRYFDEKFYVSVHDILAYDEAPRNPYLISIYQVLRQQARICVVEHPFMVSVIDMFADRFIYSSQNNETELKRQLLQYHPDKRTLLASVEEAESIAIEDSIGIVAVSDDDAASFVAGRARSAPIVVIPNGSSPLRPASEKDRAQVTTKIGPRSAVFVGSGHIPNVDAANFIVQVLAQACENIQFHLVGGVCDALPKNLPKNVVLWGIVADEQKTAILESCSVALNPVDSGSGSNVKQADYLSNGLCVISTKFGVRGYPVLDEKDVRVADRADFVDALKAAINDERVCGSRARAERKKVFADQFTMQTIAKRFVDLLKVWTSPKARVLFVTYRYTDPALGGAELYLLNLLSGLNDTNEFAIDVACTEVTWIHDKHRFVGGYEHAPKIGAPIGMVNVRYTRFPLNQDNRKQSWDELCSAWRAQPSFEETLFDRLRSRQTNSGLAWGWGYPERADDGSSARWMFQSAGIFLAQSAAIALRGWAPGSGVLTIQSENGVIVYHEEVSENIDVAFEADAGILKFIWSQASTPVASDPRPIVLRVSELLFDNKSFDLGQPTLLNVAALPTSEGFAALADAAKETRSRRHVRLTDIRGPHSSELELFIENSIRSYDLVITHNSVFRPPVFAVEAANRHRVPVIMIPHAHLDDDFYHFDDVLQASLAADVTLASPKAACEFFERRGARNPIYHSPGIDVSERLTADQIAAFGALYRHEGPFLLVLGRKAPAKGYRRVIEAIDTINLRTKIRLVMIGPDDDRLPIESPNVSYLGQQPREIVLGALQSCAALVNMSTSESFGMVLLEAWLAKRPVIANSDCAAFHDLATHEEDALLIPPAELESAIVRLLADEKLATRLAAKGHQKLHYHDWAKVKQEFAQTCRDALSKASAFDSMARYFNIKEGAVE